MITMMICKDDDGDGDDGDGNNGVDSVGPEDSVDSDGDYDTVYDDDDYVGMLTVTCSRRLNSSFAASLENTFLFIEIILSIGYKFLPSYPLPS